MLQVDEKMVSVVQDIVVSYETQISTIGALVDNTYGILQESRAALGKVNSQLRETLANRASLRKKDYDSMIAEIEAQQEERHQEIKKVLSEFVLVHKEAASQLKELLAIAQSGKIVDFRAVISSIQSRQDVAQKKVISSLRANEEEQERVIAEVQKLLNGNGTTRVKDFKDALSKLRDGQKDSSSLTEKTGISNARELTKNILKIY